MSAKRKYAFQPSRYPRSSATIVATLTREFRGAAQALDRGMPATRFARLEDGALHLTRPDALEEPARVVRLRRIRIEDVLHDVDGQCGLTRAFQYNGAVDFTQPGRRAGCAPYSSSSRPFVIPAAWRA